MKDALDQFITGVQHLGWPGMLTLIVILGAIMYALASILKNQQIENLKSKNEAAEERVKVRDDRLEDLAEKLIRQEAVTKELQDQSTMLQELVADQASSSRLAAAAKSIDRLAGDVHTANSEVSLAVADAFNSKFVCANCGEPSNRWAGKCSACGEWNTITERSKYVLTPEMKAHPVLKGYRPDRSDSLPFGIERDATTGQFKSKDQKPT